MKNNKNVPYTFFCGIFFMLVLHQKVFTQDLENELLNKFSVPEKQNMEKAASIIQKTDDLVQSALLERDQADKNSDLEMRKAEKNYALKRYNAGDQYEQAYSIKYEQLKESVKTFWKQFKGDKKSLSFVKIYEQTANDSIKKGFNNRKKSKDILNSEEKLSISLQAESCLKKYITLYEKVAYCYWNFPLQIDPKWWLSDEASVPKGMSSKNQIDTTSQKMTDNSLQNISSDTSANISNKIISDTVSNATSMNKESAQNVYNDSIAVHPSEKIVQAPLNKDTVINQSQISKTNDSSLYARVKVKEGDIETFNTFLKKQYPSKYESYIANLQLLSYSVIETVTNVHGINI